MTVPGLVPFFSQTGPKRETIGADHDGNIFPSAFDVIVGELFLSKDETVGSYVESVSERGIQVSLKNLDSVTVQHDGFNHDSPGLILAEPHRAGGRGDSEALMVVDDQHVASNPRHLAPVGVIDVHRQHDLLIFLAFFEGHQFLATFVRLRKYESRNVGEDVPAQVHLGPHRCPLAFGR